MATQRYISTSFWDDAWIQTLDPSEKLMYLYLMTNPLTTISGAYKITKRRMSFDTGYNIDTIEKILNRFGKDGKAHLYGEYMIIPSWPKHQQYEKRSKIREGIENELQKIPEDVKKYMVSIGYAYPIKGYEYVPNYLDLDLDLDTDLDTDTDTNSDIDTDSNTPPQKNDFPQRFEKVKNYANEKIATKGLAPYRGTALNIREFDRKDIITTFSYYSDTEICKAVDNYGHIRDHPEKFDVFPEYTSVTGFLRSGVEKFCTDADPFTRCGKGEDAGDRVEKMRKYLENKNAN